VRMLRMKFLKLDGRSVAVRGRSVALAGGVLALALAGCSSTGGSGEGNGDMNQLANPASAYCVEQGGTVEIVSEAYGEVGYCNLPDGTRVDEWEYFRANNPEAE